jgi:CheY-like chemotaxis protein
MFWAPMEPALTVAVVDDELPIRKALTRLLRSASYQVLSYGSGSEFLASLENSKPACLVLDIRMQGMTGFDVQAWLQAQRITLPNKAARSRCCASRSETTSSSPPSRPRPTLTARGGERVIHTQPARLESTRAKAGSG